MPTTTVFVPSLFPLPAPAVHHVSQSWWTCHSGASGCHRYRERFDTMLEPGLLLTVMPPTVTERFDLEIHPEPGWKGRIPSWFGIPCRLGRVTICCLSSKVRRRCGTCLCWLSSLATSWKMRRRLCNSVRNSYWSTEPNYPWTTPRRTVRAGC